VMVKKLMTQQEPGIAEREQALARQTPEERSERLARARARVELFNQPRAVPAAAAKPRIELFGAAASLQRTVRARLVEEA
jgi:chemotaxis protein CheD